MLVIASGLTPSASLRQASSEAISRSAQAKTALSHTTLIAVTRGGDVTFRFYAELNDFLPPARRGVPFRCAFDVPGAVKDLIEAAGVPHTEVDLILANGESVDFAYRVRDGDRISVYPVFETLDISPVLRVRPEPLRRIRFVLDTHLGRLAAYLRLMGFDTLYRNDFSDPELADTAQSEHRIVLTKDRGLLKRSQMTHGYCIRATNPQEQLAEVIRRFDLTGAARPFTRCLRCNGLLRRVPKEAISHLLPWGTAACYEEYARCESCGQVYWPGSHYRRLRQLVDGMLGQG
jgi:uncharacterized protein with PIN domain